MKTARRGGLPRAELFATVKLAYCGLPGADAPVFGSVCGPAALAAMGFDASAPQRVIYGIDGGTLKGISSRSATVPTGFLLRRSTLAFHGSSFTRPPIGSAAIICGFCF